MYDSQLEEDGKEEVNARKDQYVAMVAEMERSMVDLANMVTNLIILITT